jgi:phosphatidylserine decarboxylase
MSWTLHLLRFLPRNLLSRAFGWFAACEHPPFLARFVVRWFARRYAVNLEEAAAPLQGYPSLLKLFTRRLRDGVRPIAEGAKILVSPVDASTGCFGVIQQGLLLQAKGMQYELAALLGSKAAADRFEGGAYLTLYLSPRDYHRIHSPVQGEITQSLYEPGTLWPVNPPAVRRIPALFAVNERVTTWLESQHGPLAVVMIGATNVGRIRLAYADFATNMGRRSRQVLQHRPALPVASGADLGTFELGSTVVLVVGDPQFVWADLQPGQWLPYGSALGHFSQGGERLS